MNSYNMQARIYDWNGTLVTKDGFLDWLKSEHRNVYDEYWVRGKTDQEAKRKAKPEVARLFEYASENDLYTVALFPHVRERLHQDRQEGSVRMVFSTVSREALTTQANRLGICSELDQIVSLTEVMQRFNLTAAIKEDPTVYQHLALLLRERGFDHLKSYIDDGLPRVQAAVKANEILRQDEKIHFQQLYHFDPEAAASPQYLTGYTTVNDFRHLQ